MEKKINKDKNNPIKQHHVPKVYLKNFCEQKGQLAVLNKQTGKIFSASIDSVGFEKNFYTLSKLEDPYCWEKIYARGIEPLMGVLLPKIISKASILVRDGASIIDVREKFLLAYIMIMQLLRGKQMRAHGEELYKKLLPFILDKAIEKFEPLNAHSLELLDEFESDPYYYKQVIMKVALDSERLNRYVHILGNHIFIFLHLYGETDFVTSDNPVMFINSKTADSKPFSNGLLQKTTCVYYPLAANLLLWIVHPDMYFQSDLSMDRSLFHLNKDKEQRFISFINQKQFEQCHSQVYASEQGTLEKLEKR